MFMYMQLTTKLRNTEQLAPIDTCFKSASLSSDGNTAKKQQQKYKTVNKL